MIGARSINFGMKGTQKFRNKPTEVDGIKFDSKREAARWKALGLLLAAGRIRNLEHHKAYKLQVGGKLICRYEADFVYEEYAHGVWATIVEDCKGYRTPVYRLKRKLMEAVHGIEIRET
jgi:hypothetical protein